MATRTILPNLIYIARLDIFAITALLMTSRAFIKRYANEFHILYGIRTSSKNCSHEVAPIMGTKEGSAERNVIDDELHEMP